MPILNHPKYAAWFQEHIKHKYMLTVSPIPQHINILHIPFY